MKKSFLPLLALSALGCSGGEESSGPGNVSQEINYVPGPAPSGIKIDPKLLEVIHVTDSWAGIGTEGKPLYSVSYRIKNNSSRPLTTVELTADLSFKAHSYKTSAPVTAREIRGIATSTSRYLLPGQTSAIETWRFLTEADAYPRDDAVVKLTINSAFEMAIIEDRPEDYAQLSWLIFEGNLGKLKGLFEKNKDLIKVTTPNGYGPLHFALMQKDVGIAKYIQSLGADIKAAGPDNESAYHFAALSGAEMVKYVQSQGVRPSVTINRRESPLFNAVDRGDIAAIRALKEAGAPLNGVNSQSYTPLLYAVAVNEPEAAEELIKLGANKDYFIQGSTGMLMMAAQVASADFFERMVKAKGTMKEVAPDGNTPLHMATSNTNTDVVQWLLLHGADPNVKNKEGYAPKDYIRGNRELEAVYKDPKKPI